MNEQAQPTDERITVAEGLELRVLRWLPKGSAAPGSDGAPFLLVHGLASNARLWDGVARRMADAGRFAAALRYSPRSTFPCGWVWKGSTSDLAVPVT